MEVSMGAAVDLRLGGADFAVLDAEQTGDDGDKGFVIAEQIDGGVSLHGVVVEEAAGFAGKIEGGPLEAFPKGALRSGLAFGGDALDVAIGLIELAHDALVIDGIGVAGQHQKHVADAAFLVLQFANQAIAEGLLVDHGGGIAFDGLNIADARHRCGHQEQNHDTQPAQQHAKDVPVRDLFL
jgi:hypothetical protein